MALLPFRADSYFRRNGTISFLFVAISALQSGCAANSVHTPSRPPTPSVDAQSRARVEAPVRAADDAELAPLPAELDDLVALALSTNPEVHAARESFDASRERAPQVESLPDPKLSGRYLIQEVETRVGPQNWALGVQQNFPALGSLTALRKAADARSLAEAARLVSTILAVTLDLKVAWYELYYLEQAIESLQEDQERLQSLEQVIRRDYASGSALYTTLIRVQVELGRSENRLASMQDQRRPKVTRINSILHRPSAAPLPSPSTLPQLGRLLTTNELERRMGESNPELTRLRHDRDAADEDQRGADLVGRPGFSFGVEYISTGSAANPALAGSGTDPIIAKFSIDLPVHHARYSAARREARARSRMARSSLSATHDRLRTELERDHFLARDTERQIALYQETLIPRARQAFEAVETSFRGGQSNYIELIDAERVLLDFDLALKRALTDRMIAHARLEALVGDVITDQSSTSSNSTADGAAIQRERNPR